MSTTAKKVNCPNCGADMNHHADKFVYGTGSPTGDTIDGALQEFHACPACGSAASRPEAGAELN